MSRPKIRRHNAVKYVEIVIAPVFLSVLYVLFLRLDLAMALWLHGLAIGHIMSLWLVTVIGIVKLRQWSRMMSPDSDYLPTYARFLELLERVEASSESRSVVTGVICRHVNKGIIQYVDMYDLIESGASDQCMYARLYVARSDMRDFVLRWDSTSMIQPDGTVVTPTDHEIKKAVKAAGFGPLIVSRMELQELCEEIESCLS